MNCELSFTQRVSGGALSYGVSVYYIDGDNMIQTVPVDGRPKTSIRAGSRTGASRATRPAA